MTLALLVASAAVILWLLILSLRWARVLPVTPTIREHAIVVASGFSAAMVGGVYPVAWAIVSNLMAWGDTGRTTFTFAGHLPPGVDEDDLLMIVVVGLMVLVGQAAAGVRRIIVEANPNPEAQ